MLRHIHCPHYYVLVKTCYKVLPSLSKLKLFFSINIFIYCNKLAEWGLRTVCIEDFTEEIAKQIFGGWDYFFSFFTFFILYIAEILRLTGKDVALHSFPSLLCSCQNLLQSASSFE